MQLFYASLHHLLTILSNVLNLVISFRIAVWYLFPYLKTWRVKPKLNDIIRWSLYIMIHLCPLKPTSEENINPAMPARFFLDAYFSRSVARRLILMTLNRSDNWVSDHLPITARRLYGHWPELAPNDHFSEALSSGHRQGSCRWPLGVPAISSRCREIGGSPSGDLAATGRWSHSDRQLTRQIWAQV